MPLAALARGMLSPDVRMAASATKTGRNHRHTGGRPRHLQRANRCQRRLNVPSPLQRVARTALRGRRTTLLDLIQVVQQYVATDAEVVAVVTFLVNSGAVVLAGNFAGMRI
ncbi:MAG: hypothetical protein ACRERC_24940 [Candidatus Binatia bacterium]